MVVPERSGDCRNGIARASKKSERKSMGESFPSENRFIRLASGLAWVKFLDGAE
jgi:hypothetical protein